MANGAIKTLVTNALGVITAATKGLVNYADLQNTAAASILLGRGAGSGAGVLQEITLGSGVSLSGTTLSAAGSGGTVTSVGLSLPALFTVSGSPVTGTGTLTAVLATQAANLVFAGPSSGAAAAPTFRSLVAGDIPALAFSTLTGTPTTLAGYGITSPLNSAQGGTGNGFTKFTGPTTSEKTFTLPNASDTVACLGQAQTFSLDQTIAHTGNAALNVNSTDASGVQVTLTAANTAFGYVGTANNYPFLFSVNGTERARIDTSGNVGIGVTPARRFDVTDATGGGAYVVGITATAGTNASHGLLITFGSNSAANANAITCRRPDGTVLATFTQDSATTLLFSGKSATVTTNANLTGPITSVGNATSIASQTGTGSKFVMDTGPTLSAPNLGTPASGVLTNCTGTASGLTAGNVTTNANLTGPITSSGNATSIASQTGTGTKFVMDTAPTLIAPLTINAGTGTNASYLVFGNTGGNLYAFIDSSTGGSFTGAAYATGLFSSINSPMVFLNNNAERMRIAGNGNLGIGVSPSYRLHAQDSQSSDFVALIANTANGGNAEGLLIRAGTNSAPTNTAVLLEFQRAGDNLVLSYWQQNGAITSFVNTSDMRMKNFEETNGWGLDDLLKIPVRTFRFKGEELRRIGFPAQDAYKVFPQAFCPGDDTKKRPWGTRGGELDALMILSLQQHVAETRAEITTLKAEIASLRKAN